MTRSAEAQQLSLGVLARSRKANERRLPIHPAHFSRIDRRVRPRIFLEHGYGADFGATDDALAELVGGIRTREQLIADCDVILLPKVQAEDLAELHVGQVVWGWPHCVQDSALTQIAIDRRLTLIAFEAMNHWQPDGGFGLHVFHKNNELAGYCSVLHAMQLAGITGSYGRRLRAAVIGFGATARGAVTALNAHGVDDVRVLTNRDVAAVASPIHSTQIIQMGQDPDAPEQIWADTPDGPIPVARFLADNDIVVNCVLQDPDAPLVFVTEKDLAAFTAGQPHRRRLLRRRHGLRLGAPDLVHPADHRGGERRALLRRGPQPVLPVELGDVGEQRGVVAAHRNRSGRACGVESDPDDLPGHRDPRRRRPQSQHPVVSAPRRRLPARGPSMQLSRSTPADRSSPWEGRRRQSR